MPIGNGSIQAAGNSRVWQREFPGSGLTQTWIILDYFRAFASFLLRAWNMVIIDMPCRYTYAFGWLSFLFSM